MNYISTANGHSLENNRHSCVVTTQPRGIGGRNPQFSVVPGGVYVGGGELSKGNAALQLLSVPEKRTGSWEAVAGACPVHLL